MKRILNKPIRDEKGQALILALILLVIGGLIIGPLLSYISTGLITGQVYEERMDELYAADAGVEDALWNLRIGELEVAEGVPEILSPFAMNETNVDVTIEYVDDATFKITSTATTENDPTTTDDDSSTTIESYVSSLDLSFLLENAITSMGTVDLKEEGAKKAMVYDGDVVYCTGPAPSEDQVIAGPLGIDGEVINECVEGWPTAEQFKEYYLPDVEGFDFYDSIIDVKDYSVIGIGPLYRDGDLDIINGGSAGLTATLDGTVYVTGELDIGKTNKDFTLNLNDQTIFVENSGANAIEIGGKCTFTGSGCIIAVGDVYFSPNMESSPDDFVFVMSVNGTVWFNPNGDFYGSLAGNVEVQLQPGNTLTWSDPPGGLNFPTGELDKLEISNWKIILQ